MYDPYIVYATFIFSCKKHFKFLNNFTLIQKEYTYSVKLPENFNLKNRIPLHGHHLEPTKHSLLSQ
jgi:hypothetical protein